MIDKENERAMFAERLNWALDWNKVRQRGRGSDIIKQLKARGVVKTPQAVSKWLNGLSTPELDSLSALSQWLGVRREWLEHGVTPAFLESSHIAADGARAINVAPVRPNVTAVPLISWIQAGAWCEVSENTRVHEADEYFPCPVSISASGFALRVVGDSMTNPGNGRSYPAGSIIFVDPELVVNNGDRVVATLPGSNEATFKVLVGDAGRQYLKPINPQYPIIEITEDTLICGKIVGMFIPE